MASRLSHNKVSLSSFMNHHLKNVRVALWLAAGMLALWIAGANPAAQTKLPSRVSHINDFAGVVDARTRQRLETILENLQQRTGVQVDVATVQTAGIDIFQYSQQLSRDWDVGARSTTRKSFLLVVSIDDKKAHTQFSRTAQTILPEGTLGELAQRMRIRLNAGEIDAGLSEAIERLVNALGPRLSVTLSDLETVADSAPTPTPEVAETTTTAAPSEAVRPRKVRGQAGGTETARVVPVSQPTVVPTNPIGASDADESEMVEVTLALPLRERIVKLKEFLATYTNSKSRLRAQELLVSAHAALGDELLKGGDRTVGIEHLWRAIEEAPLESSERLYSGVIAQVPLNLYLRDERVAAFKAAQMIETKFGNDARRLLGLANFYLGIEMGDEATRLSGKAVELAPNLAEAHYTHGLGFHISMRLEEAAAAYKRALDLDQNYRAARRSLADLNRATGRAEEALASYREQLAAEPRDKAARTGVILSLLDLKRNDEAEKEITAALTEDPRNVTLLAGLSYWFAAHGDSTRALDYGRQAVNIEPRYTWSQIALARALLGEKRPLDAERAIRFARLYGKFPTLEYELASVLSAAGLYEEAAEALVSAFALKDDQIETRLGGRTLARSQDFIELLAPERRASLFQFEAADSAANAAKLKALLKFTLALQQAQEGANNEVALANAAKEFAAGDDAMRLYRQLYAANKLLRSGKSLDTVRELTEAARGNVESAIDVPAVTVSVQADELREIRARAIANGATPDVPEAPRNVLANILRGRIEDLAGWTLFNQEKPAEAIEHLRRAVNILPEGTPAWTTATWHLGVALEQTGNREEALTYYIKSYNSTGYHDTVRRSIIEQLYARVNGSTAGLDERIGVAPSMPNPNATPSVEAPATPSPAVENSPETPAASPSPAAEVTASAQAEPSPSPSESVPLDAEPAATPEVTPEVTPQTTPETTPDTTPNPIASPSSSPEAASPEPTPSETPTPTPAASPARTSSEPSLSDLPAARPSPRSVVKLTGRVRDAEGKGIENVVVVLISPRGSVLASTTDAEGNFSFTVSPSDKPFRVLPSKDGISFDPIDRTVVISTDDVKDVDFAGKPVVAPPGE